jgi:hypothetical protein
MYKLNRKIIKSFGRNKWSPKLSKEEFKMVNTSLLNSADVDRDSNQK